MTDTISYNVLFHPSPTTIGVSVTVVNEALTATITRVPDVGLSLQPAGDQVQRIMSEILVPVANLVVGFVNPKPRDMLQGKTETLGKIPPFSFDNVTITASSLALVGATLAGTPYLKATANLSLAVTPPKGSHG